MRRSRLALANYSTNSCPSLPIRQPGRITVCSFTARNDDTRRIRCRREGLAGRRELGEEPRRLSEPELGEAPAETLHVQHHVVQPVPEEGRSQIPMNEPCKCVYRRIADRQHARRARTDT
jgi:hypothetical protein